MLFVCQPVQVHQEESVFVCAHLGLKRPDEISPESPSTMEVADVERPSDKTSDDFAHSSLKTILSCLCVLQHEEHKQTSRRSCRIRRTRAISCRCCNFVLLQSKSLFFVPRIQGADATMQYQLVASFGLQHQLVAICRLCRQLCSVTPRLCGTCASNNSNIVRTRRQEFPLAKPIPPMKAPLVPHFS